MDRPAPQIGHRRNKSSTSVLKSFINPKSLSRSTGTKGKENTTPPATANSNTPPVHTPIWAEFSVQSPQQGNSVSTTKIPLNDRSVQQEINMYTPQDYSPSKQRNFHDLQRPSLMQKERPKSEYLLKNKSGISIFETFTRSTTDLSRDAKQKSEKTKKSVGKASKTTKVPLKGEGGAERVVKATRSASRDILTMARKGTRVMGLVAAFNSKTGPQEAELDPKEIDAQLEAVLVRN
jgi:hypothetical protein